MQVAVAFVVTRQISLDGVLTIPHELPPPFGAVALCHAHPVLGGSMEQPLIRLVARALEQRGIASLRFNYRGVGKSQGMFTMGKQEPDDVRAALRLLKAWKGVDGRRLGVMGYSFGGTMAVKAVARERRIKAMALVAPPTNAFPSDDLRRWKGNALFIGGSRDLIAESAEVQRIAAERGATAQCVTIEGADHALAGHEAEVADAVADFFSARFAK